MGQSVGDGDVLALSGASGTVSGPNLHFGVYQNGVAVDPETQLAPDLSTIDDTGLDLSTFIDPSATPDPVMLGATALALGLLVYSAL